VEVNIVPPDSNRAIILIDQSMHESFRDWAIQITDQVNLSSMLEGSGDPDGVQSAKRKKEYMDTSGVSGAIKYIKQVDDIAGDTTLGWVLV